ncbi:hypothetical protein FOG50_01332 [Hanseniaspora uvarum]|nr:hypothetical protein FOG50_01332 [Hanseniaspora uvarum]GMM40254.1 hypothetical protein DAHU10_011550 [Hanseniaspora uvarum]
MMYRSLFRPLSATLIRSAPTLKKNLNLRVLSKRANATVNVPKTQKAVVFYKHNDGLKYQDIKTPEPKSNELLVKILYSGVCHTDLHVYKGDWTEINYKFDPYLVGGHEGAGIVVGMGSQVKGWKLGDLAGIKWLQSSCQACEYCETGHESNCDHAELSGATHNGSFQQYATTDAVQAARLTNPKDLDVWGEEKFAEYMAKVSPILCGGLTVYKALKSSNLKANQWCLVTGCGGGLGSLATQYANAMGFRVIGIDSGEEKEKFFKRLGGEVFIDFKKTNDIVSDIQQATKGGPHAVINLATSSDSISLSTKYCRTNGTIVLVGLPAGAVVKSDVFDHVVKSLNIVGSYVGNRADTREALEFFNRGLIKSEIKVVGLSELEHVFEDMENGRVVGRVVVDTSK